MVWKTILEGTLIGSFGSTTATANYSEFVLDALVFCECSWMVECFKVSENTNLDSESWTYTNVGSGLGT